MSELDIFLFLYKEADLTDKFVQRRGRIRLSIQGISI